MSERSHLDTLPADLVPLGIVHNDERRDDLMAAVDLAQRKGAVALWGYPGYHSPSLRRIPQNYELNWMGGPGREEGDNPDCPGLAYYCDVTAAPRLRADTPGAYVLHAGAADAEVFTQVQISKAVLARLRSGEIATTPEHRDEADPEHGQATQLQAYKQRIAECEKRGKTPPLETTKNGTTGDREWAAANKVPRTKIAAWRTELLAERKRGRPQNSAKNSAKE
jgi:hypothetical protein